LGSGKKIWEVDNEGKNFAMLTQNIGGDRKDVLAERRGKPRLYGISVA
jgi:hypothetical protein